MKVLGIFALSILAAPAMRAQSGPDQFGRITDVGGHAILGAEIVASCAGKSKPIVFHVDEKGDYGLGFGEPNGIDCSLEIRAQGYETISVPKGNFHECANVRVNYTMYAVARPSHLRTPRTEASSEAYANRRWLDPRLASHHATAAATNASWV